MEDESRKPHRKRQAGRKAEKKKKKVTGGQPNPKAFAYNSARSAEKAFHRTADVLEKKHHPLVVDRKSELPPPVVVVVAGPPKVGKTTLIQALVKHYAKKRISKVQGPITVISGKGENKTTKRLTFIESLCDIHCMIDVAKVADLVILMMNAEKKHQMETFEFLTLCRAHNFTKILGVVTHLDKMKTNKLKKKKKKMIKTRFWTEVCQGAKIHFLDGFDKASYMKNQVRLLSHSVNRVKYAPRTWLTTHPYIIADRMEDITNPEETRKNPVAERTVCLYGYIRGTLFNSQVIHIPGCGDYAVQNISSIADPCPPLDQIKKRSLNDRERRLYAPMSGVGGILYDRDAIYMDIGGSHALRSETEREGEIGELITSLKDVKNTIDEKIASSRLGLEHDFSDVEEDDEDEEGTSDMDVDNDDEDSSGDDNIDGDYEDDTEFEDDEENEEEGSGDEDDEDELGVGGASKKRKRANGMKDLVPRKKRKQISDDDDDEEEEEIEEDDNDENLTDATWKKGLREKGIEAFHGRRGRLTMEAIIYNPPENILPLSDEEEEDGGDDNELIGGLFRPLGKKHRSAKKCWIDDEECTTSKTSAAKEEAEDELVSRIRDCFVTGKFAKGEDAQSALEQDDETYGDFEDLERNDDVASKNSDASGDDDKGSDDYYGSEDDDEDDEDLDDGDEKADSTKPPVDETPEERRERRMKAKLLAKKKRQKALFNSGGLDSTKDEKTYYEMQREDMQRQAELNRSEFKNLDEETRIKIEGFRPGLYVRVELKIDHEFVKYFDPTYPIILGGILPKEDELGFVTAKIQVHRYQKLPLRDRDPSMISLGWRRMESMLLFSVQQDNLVYRALKMARPCVSCTATFWGPMTPQGTSILMFSTDLARKFRITAVGSVSKQEKSLDITKKVPLIGYPFKIFNKTAFVKDMFCSSLEVAKFENAAIQTVSGIRGTIKKVAGKGPPGTFRATFEDKILQSDIIILKATTTLDKTVHKYWQSVPNYLLPVEKRSEWVGMKSRYQLEKERNTKREFNPDSVYKPITRPEKVFRPLAIPLDLQKELPYKDKPKVDVQRKDKVQSSRIAVIKEPHERRRDELMKKIMMVEKQKRSEERQKMRSRSAAHTKKMAEIEAKKQAKAKVQMKKAYAKAGQANKKKSA